MDRLLIGCAGWHYTDWVGVLYPRRLASASWLSHYASVFPIVEVDSTFYSLPSEATVRGWIDKVQERRGFAFAAKVPSSATHEALPAGRRAEVVASCEAFERAVVAPLSDAARLDSILVQLPPRFERRTDALRNLTDLLDALGAHRRRLVVEFRHPSWFDEGNRLESDAGRTLQGLGVAVAQVDGLGFKPTGTTTTSWRYFRFHGRRGPVPEAERDLPHAPYNYLYPRQEIEELAAAVRLGQEIADRTSVIFNNHYRGQAAKNALDLMAALGQSPPASLDVPKESRLDDFVA